jgi:integrase
MAKGLNKLSALQVQKAKDPGYYGDGGGLWLQISKLGGKSWVFRFVRHGKAREMGLGAIHTVSLAEAREKALQYRKMLLENKDPIEERKIARLHSQFQSASAKTFTECATAYIAAHKSGWKNEKHGKQWAATLETYAFPVMGKLPIAAINTPLILSALEPIWQTKTETASRLRGRIESILDWAAVRGLRQGENPARWKGHLDKLLPARNKVQKVKHLEALPYSAIGQFMTELRGRDGMSARALEFAILTAARSGEVRGATWDEIDFEGSIWKIPASRMKAGKEHRVPLSEQTIKLLENITRIAGSNHIFPAPRKGQLSDMALTSVIKRMGYDGLTQHGFRSTFRDWAGETTAHPREVIEHALAHQLRDKAEAAYQRGDLLVKRILLMRDWGRFCTNITENQISSDSHHTD